MEKEKTIEVLNSLITINNDRIAGYETASNETEDFELKTLFEQFILTSEKCKLELIREVNALGGEVAESTLVSGKFFRAWMDVKATLTGEDRKEILNSCEYGEDQALKTYEEVLTNDAEHLTAEHESMIYNQKSLLQADHKQIKLMRDILLDTPITGQLSSF